MQPIYFSCQVMQCFSNNFPLWIRGVEALHQEADSIQQWLASNAGVTGKNRSPTLGFPFELVCGRLSRMVSFVQGPFGALRPKIELRHLHLFILIYQCALHLCIFNMFHIFLCVRIVTL